MKPILALFALTALCATASAADVVTDFNVTGVLSMDLVGDSNNQIYTMDLAAAAGLPTGTPVVVTGIGWDVNITTYDGSLLDQASVYLDDNINPDQTGVFMIPGFGDLVGGTRAYSSGGILLLSDVSIPNLVLPNGVLRLEFYESISDDVPNGADAIWNSGLLSIQFTPEPGSLALLALGGLAMIRRR
jgi:hypothetical protein